MNSKIRSQIQEIKCKVKNPITGRRQFDSDDEVIEYGIILLKTELKKRKLI